MMATKTNVDDLLAQWDDKEAPTPATQPAPPVIPPAPVQPVNVRDQSAPAVVPGQRVHAQFTDEAGKPVGDPMTAEQIGTMGDMAARDMRGKAAFIGGALNAATLGYGDEAAALVDSLRAGEGGTEGYRKKRDEYRSAIDTSREFDPGEFGKGSVAGMGTSIIAQMGGPLAVAGALGRLGLSGPAISNIIESAAKNPSLLLNALKGGAVGGAVGLGESRADLTTGEFGQAVRDAAAPVLLGLGAGAAPVLAGKGYSYLQGAPGRVGARADEELLGQVAGEGQGNRAKLVGEAGAEKQDMLGLVKGTPGLPQAVKAGEYPEAMAIVKNQRVNVAEASGKAAAKEAAERIESFEMSEPIAKLEKIQAKLAENPATLDAAKTLGKRIDALKEQYVQGGATKAPKEATLGMLIENAKKRDVDRAGNSAADFATVAKKYKLDKMAHEPDMRAAKIDEHLSTLNEANDKIYEPVSAHTANVQGVLYDYADKLAKGLNKPGSDAVRKFANEFRDVMSEQGKTAMSARELRQIITNEAADAFSGSFTDPAAGKKVWQGMTGKLSGYLEEQVSKQAGAKALRELKANNKDISVLIPFKRSADAEIAEKSLSAPLSPDRRSGTASIQDVLGMIRATDNPEMKAVLTKELYKQVGPTIAQKMQAAETEAGRLQRLEEILSQTGLERAAAKPDTVRPLSSLLGRARQEALEGVDVGAAKLLESRPARAISFALSKGVKPAALKIIGLASGLTEDQIGQIIKATAARGIGSFGAQASGHMEQR
jgi:hypothetical protein